MMLVVPLQLAVTLQRRAVVMPGTGILLGVIRVMALVRGAVVVRRVLGLRIRSALHRVSSS
jgi:hypothetical protein